MIPVVGVLHAHSWRSRNLSLLAQVTSPVQERSYPVDIIHDIAIHPKCKQLFCCLAYKFAEKSLQISRKIAWVDARFIPKVSKALHVLLLANLLKVVSIQDWAPKQPFTSTPTYIWYHLGKRIDDRWPENLIKCTTRVILHWCIRQRCNLPTLHQGMIYNIYIYTYIQTSSCIIYILTLTYFNIFIYFLPSPSPNFSHPQPRSLTLRAPMMPVTALPTRAAAAWRRRVAQEPPVVHRHRLWIHRDDPLRSKVAIRSWPVRLLFCWKFGLEMLGLVGWCWV